MHQGTRPEAIEARDLSAVRVNITALLPEQATDLELWRCDSYGTDLITPQQWMTDDKDSLSAWSILHAQAGSLS